MLAIIKGPLLYLLYAGIGRVKRQQTKRERNAKKYREEKLVACVATEVG